MLNLEKNQTLTLDLKKEGINEINIGLGWDSKLDLDVHAMLRNEKGQVLDTVYYGKLIAKGVKLSGDNLTGEGDGDDETIYINKAFLPKEVATVSIYVNIFTNNRTFNNVDGGFMRVYNPKTNEEFAISNLDLYELQDKRCVHFIEIDTKTDELTFKVIMDGDVTLHNLTNRYKRVVFNPSQKKEDKVLEDIKKESIKIKKEEAPKKKKRFFGLF